MAGDHAVGEADRVAKLRQRGAEQRDAVVARNMVERAFEATRQPVVRVGTEAGFGPWDCGGGVHGYPLRSVVGRETIRLLTLMQVTPHPAPDAIHRKFNSSARSEERRAGKECVSTCRSRWSPYH